MRFMIIGKATKESEAGILVEIRKVMGVEDFGDEFTPSPEIAKVKIK